MDDFTGELKNQIATLESGQVAGPFSENNTYVLLKLIDKSVIADSVKARHILKSTATMTEDAAMKEIDS